MTDTGFDNLGILANAFIKINAMPADVDLVQRIRDLNSMGPEIPWMWSLSLDTEATGPNRVEFGVGVYGAIGALHWASNAGDDLVPVCGTSTHSVLYYLAGMYDSEMPPGAEVPVETVYRAATEFLTTHQRPTCVRWRQAPPSSWLPTTQRTAVD
ncbi:MAG TPA: Imm1 family immunity protein [Pseudonocardiaceae bacterium]